jgi:electron transport complex protein RnfG
MPETPAMPGDASPIGQLLARPVLIAVLAGLVVAVAVALTRERIAGNEAARTMKVLATVLPPGSYDNQPHLDRIFVRAPALLGHDGPLPLYRARKSGEPAGVVVTVIARQGYIGPIRMLVAIRADGRIEGVRVIGHEETPGLGDQIEPEKSGWISQFAGRSLADPAPPGWAVRRDGGAYDALTGATVTSRAVIHAVRDAALYFAQNRDEVFRRPAEQVPGAVANP